MASMEKEERDGANHAVAKKRGTSRALGVFRAAIFVIRRRSSGKKATIRTDLLESGATNDGSTAAWKNLVGGMRPLHLQGLASPPAPPLLPPPPPAGLEFHDVPLPPPSPECSDDGMSRYASAEDLQALNKSKGDDGDGEKAGSVDVRAEEFIARFYEQMRLQRLESFNRYNEMIEQGAS